MLGTSALNVKSRTFYNNYGCNTKKMKYHGCNTKVHTKNMDFSNIIISATCYLARDLILYFIAAWPSPDLFSQDKKWTSVKIVFISKFLVKTKEVNFSFFTFSRLLMMTFCFLHILNFNNFVVDNNSKNSMFTWRSNGLLLLYKHLMWCAYDLHNMFA